jgi:hypothetical protein
MHQQDPIHLTDEGVEALRRRLGAALRDAGLGAYIPAHQLRVACDTIDLGTVSFDVARWLANHLTDLAEGRAPAIPGTSPDGERLVREQRVATLRDLLGEQHTMPEGYARPHVKVAR